jgi:hypothetical protein
VAEEPGLVGFLLLCSRPVAIVRSDTF